MIAHEISPQAKAHMHHTSEMLHRLVPTLHGFNQAMVAASQRLTGRPARQSLMGLALHGQQCENELASVVRQYEVTPLAEGRRQDEAVELPAEDAVAFALREETKLDRLYNELIEDKALDNSVSSLLKNQAQHLKQQFMQLRFLHGCMPQIGMMA